jgi:hypothetical protein
MKIHQKQAISLNLQVEEKGYTYFENQALNHLCRPLEFEDMSLKEFAERCEVIIVGGKNKKRPMFPFEVNTGYYKHPSAVQKGPRNNETLQCNQGARKREKMVHNNTIQYLFPNTVDFQGNITSCDECKINLSMEKCAKATLCLLMPRQSVDDLKSMGTIGPYAKRLQEQYNIDMRSKTAGRKVCMFTDSNIDFLQKYTKLW